MSSTPGYLSKAIDLEAGELPPDAYAAQIIERLKVITHETLGASPLTVEEDLYHDGLHAFDAAHGDFSGSLRCSLATDTVLQKGGARQKPLLLVKIQRRSHSFQSSAAHATRLVERGRIIGVLIAGPVFAGLTLAAIATFVIATDSLDAVSNFTHPLSYILAGAFTLGGAIGAGIGGAMGEKKVQAALEDARDDQSYQDALAAWYDFTHQVDALLAAHTIYPIAL